MLHRDLAARNCLVGGECELKIADFGKSEGDTTDFKVAKVKNLPVKWSPPEVFLEVRIFTLLFFQITLGPLFDKERRVELRRHDVGNLHAMHERALSKQAKPRDPGRGKYFSFFMIFLLAFINFFTSDQSKRMHTRNPAKMPSRRRRSHEAVLEIRMFLFVFLRNVLFISEQRSPP